VIHYVEHGAGRPVVVLHGAGVDHREAEACFEPVLEGVSDLRRIYPDLPGMGRTIAPETLGSADDVLDTLLDFADAVTGGRPLLLIGHSAGGYYARAMAAVPGEGGWPGAGLPAAACSPGRPGAPRRRRIGRDR